MTCKRSVFPFSAIVGQERMKKSLILNAINPKLGGVLIRGEKGTAKSTAVRALASLLPEIDVVAGCPFHCNPHSTTEMCRECLAKTNAGEILTVVKKKTPLADLPLGATEDRVIGTLDLERAIKKGERNFDPGILATVNRGILYVDEVNLLDDHLVDILLDVAAMGINYVEREGVSYSHPAKFILVGTMNPEEGELRPQFLDRFGLCVDVEGINDPAQRVEVVKRYLAYEQDAHAFEHKWRTEEDRVGNLIERGQELLTNVTYDDSMLELIATIALDMAVDGHRADIAILKTAHTIAAYHERATVTEKDVREAAELVLLHRMKRKPFEDSKVDNQKLDKSFEKHKNQKNDSQAGKDAKKKILKT
jgi:magnesium chelatase subunit D